MDSVKMYNGVEIPKVMLGSFQMNSQSDMDAVVKAAVEQGVFGFDTSPSYKTETLLASAVHKLIREDSSLSRESFFLDSKIDSWQMIEKKGDIRPFVKTTLAKTKLEYWDLLLIHWPQPEFFAKTWLCMEKLYEEGLVKSIGVCNCSVRQFRELEHAGAKYIPMVAQNEIYPLNTEEEIVDYCQSRGTIVQAYSPLGRMIPEVKYNALLNILAEKYGVSVAQIILRWHVERNMVPVVKTSNPKRVAENTDIFSFSLSEEDHKAIDRLDRHLKLFLESRCCPGY